VGILNIKAAEFPLKSLKGLMQTRDPGRRRPVMAPGHQLSDTIFRAFSDHFHRAFTPVPDPAVNPQPLRFSAGALAKPHALHSPFNNQPHSDVVHHSDLKKISDK
jgi:hypothetical protein